MKHQFKKRYLACVIAGISISGCNSGSTSTSSTTSGCQAGGTCIMFYAGNNGVGYTGDLLGNALAMGATNINTGIQGADYICESEALNSSWHPNLPSGKKWKAMIVDGVNRNACSSAYCNSGTESQKDWVFYPQTSYMAEDNKFISTTNESSVFLFPVQASFAKGSTSESQVGIYTGLSQHEYRDGMSLVYTTSPAKCESNGIAWTAPNASTSPTGFSNGLLIVNGNDIYPTVIDNNLLLNTGTRNCSEHSSNYQWSTGTAHNTIGLICVQQN